MTSTRSVTGTILRPNGDPWSGFQIDFTLTPSAVTASATLPSSTVSTTTNSLGEFSVTLETSVKYSVVERGALIGGNGGAIRYPSGTTYFITVPDGNTPISIESIRASEVVGPVTGGFDGLVDTVDDHIADHANPHVVTAAQLTDLDSEVTASPDVAANTLARHAHANKSLLDTYDQTNANISDAVTKRHTHSNKSTLDATTASYTTAEQNKLSAVAARVTAAEGAVPILSRQVAVGTPAGPVLVGTGNPVEMLSLSLDDCSDSTAWAASSSGTVTAYTDDPAHPIALEFGSPTGSPGTYTEVSRDLVCSLTDRFLSFWFMRLDDDFDRVGVGISVNGRSFTQRFECTPVRKSGTVLNRWHRVTISNPIYTAGGSPTPTGDLLADVRALRFQVFPASGESTSIVIADIRSHPYILPPGIVWQFDDGRADTYTTAFPILEGLGIRGSIAVETGNVGNSDRCSLAQLQEMQAAGWEMVSHTVSGNQLSSSNMATLRTQLRDSYNYLMSNGFTSGAKHFVYPGGTWDATILSEVLRHYRTARCAGSQNYETPGVTERGLLRPYYMGTGVSLATAKAGLDRIAGRGGVAIFDFHSLVASQVQTEDWMISDFTELATYAVSLGLANYVPSEVWL